MFSGGQDSVVLLHVLLELSNAGFYPKPQVVHINHQLQSCADDMAQWCREYCEHLGLTYQEVKVQVDERYGIEAGARQARYQALALLVEQPGQMVVTAHHADDQVETFSAAVTQ